MMLLRMGTIALSLTLGMASLPPVSLAQHQEDISYVRTVNDQDAVLGRVTIDVASGYGTNISFQRLNERIIRVWIDDMSELLVDFDRPIPESKVIHLRRLKVGNIPLQTRSSKNNTLMTVVTEKKIYQFFIRFINEKGSYKTVEIVSGSQQGSLNIVPVGGQGFATLKEIEQGIENAIRDGLISMDSVLIPRVRKFIILVRSGKGITEASEEAGVSLAVVSEFGRLGNKLPSVLEQFRNKAREDKE